MSRRNKGRIGGPFVPMLKDTMRTEAWKALSHGARSLYAALKGRCNSKLQNSVYLAGRAASEELGSFSHRDNVRRWFRELEYYGFIRMVRLAHHGLNGHGRAPHYRLTEEWYSGQAPTRDYLNWDGVIFHEQRPPAHYQTKNRSRGPDGWSTLAQTGGPVIDQTASINGTSGPPVQAMCEEGCGPPVQAITSSTTPLSHLEPTVALEEIQISPSELAQRVKRMEELYSNDNPPIVVTDYGLALAMVSPVLSYRERASG